MRFFPLQNIKVWQDNQFLIKSCPGYLSTYRNYSDIVKLLRTIGTKLNLCGGKTIGTNQMFGREEKMERNDRKKMERRKMDGQVQRIGK